MLISASLFVAIRTPTTSISVSTTTTTYTQTMTVGQPPYTSVITSVSTTTTTTISTTTVTCFSDTIPCGSFTYTPTGLVRVDLINATQRVCENCGGVNGESYVYFAVTIANVGNSTVYLAGGTGELSSSVPANSSVLHQVTTQVCPGTFEIVALDKGQNATLYAPGCDFGVLYQLVQAGSVGVGFDFHWTTVADSDEFPNTTTISATFVFT